VAAIELEIPARTEYLGLIRLVVSAAATLDPVVPESRLDDLRLAVTEACANAIDAQDPSDPQPPIRIRCEVTADRVEVTVEDNGGGFDPELLTELPSATDPRRLRHERGLGIPLMRLLADGVEFTPVGDGTAVRLTVLGGNRTS
jgi:serine/threonine-protein kinase RsbW